MAENTEVKEREYPEEIFFEDERYKKLMMQYHCAILEVETKFRVLNSEFSLQYNRNPIETIKTRLKSPHSIVEKVQRKGWELTPETIEANLSDIAGVRVICSFPEDIYFLAKKLMQQDDIVVVEIKDYIANPKPNGYRSLHLILEVPIFLSDRKKHVRAEVQFRTIAMDSGQVWNTSSNTSRISRMRTGSRMNCANVRIPSVRWTTGCRESAK